MNCNQTANSQSKSLIKNTVKKIDQLQKEATLQNTCEGCEGSLFATMYNTRPVSFYLCSGVLFSVQNPDDLTTTTTLFRIEDVRDDGVILRLLVGTGEDTVCTNYTVLFDLDCACGMQCFSPICCDECTRACGM